MTNASNIIAAAVVPLSGAIGGKLAVVTANAAPIDPLWGQILGPVGFLIGCLFAIRWLTKRLEKSEENQADNLKTLTTICVQTKTVIEQNSELLEEVKEIVRKRD